jgi:hypothetical protein
MQNFGTLKGMPRMLAANPTEEILDGRYRKEEGVREAGQDRPKE